MTAGSAALAAQIRKHRVNDERCRELGWVCIPLVVETYGRWGTEAFTHYQDLPPVCPLGRDVPSHLCAMKYLSAHQEVGCGWETIMPEHD